MKKKGIINKSRSLAAMFVSENSIKHFIWSKIHPIHPINTTHLRHFKQALCKLAVSTQHRYSCILEKGLWQPSCFTNDAHNQ